MKRITIIALALLMRALFTAEPDAAGIEFFKVSVLPILEKNCYECHSHAANKMKAGLALDSKSGWVAGGENGPALVPGKPESSLLIKAVHHTDADLRMPPKRKLADDAIAAFEKWVAMGAPDPRVLAPRATRENAGNYWAFKPLVRPALPVNPADLKAAPQAAGTMPADQIDAFVRAKLREHGLALAPEADRRTWIRRVYFDVIGLPPSPEDIDAFIADAAPDAIERLVDKLLASPRYGERWARHWLDVVRFAESHGFEMNNARPNAWPYRDYVIRAFNADLPYDRFIREQLAGDALGADEATGFLVGGPWDQVKSPDPVLTAQQRADELNDIVATTSASFLALTVNCARCHDHKFDPIPAADYYALTAIFQGVKHGERPIKNEPAESTTASKHERESLAKELAQIDGELAKGTVRPPVTPRLNTEILDDIEAKFLRFTVTACSSGEPCIDELEAFTAGTPPRNVALASAGAVATASGVYANGGNPIHQLAHINDGLYGNSKSWISNESGKGWVQIEFKNAERIRRVLWSRDRGTEGRIFEDRVATGYRIETSLDGKEWKTVATSGTRLPVEYVKRKPAALAASTGAKIDEVNGVLKILAYRSKLEDRLRKLAASQIAYIGQFEQPLPTFILNRGDPMQKRAPAPPGALSLIGSTLSLPVNTPERERRMALANWIADPQNPLTARVMANRLWHYHFGTGIVDTPSDFGANGGKPSHPELLDWLAGEFIARGWSVKALHRAILLSATYRQFSQPNPTEMKTGMKADAAARLLWRFPPRRLEAETLRDTMLSVCGKLDLKMGGPGFDLFEANTNYVKVYNSKNTFGPEDFRRMIYQSKPRTQLDAVFGAFDCPDAGQSAPRRTSSITPLQALNLLNSPFAMQMAGYFAERLERDAGSNTEAQARRGFLLAFGREATTEELAASVKTIRDAGLKIFCRALFNANEFVTVN